MITFQDAVMQCFKNKQFMREYNRLAGTHLNEDKTGIAPIEILIDDACTEVSEEYKQDLRDFIAIIDKTVWQPLLMQGIKEKQ